MKKLIALIFFTTLISKHSTQNLCPIDQCNVLLLSQCLPWTSFSLNKNNFDPSSPAEAPPILGCDVCSLIAPNLAACVTCKAGLLPVEPTGHNIFSSVSGFKFQCNAASCSVNYCETCTSDPTSCDVCEKGYFLVDGNPKSCSPCPSRCAACISHTRCTECKALPPALL